MTTAQPLRCGTWPSPLTAEVAAAGAASLIYAAAHRGTLYWLENRPAERGRSVLMARQKRIGSYWFRRVNPLDRFAIDAGGRLCFTDLWLLYDLETRGRRASYAAVAYDFEGKTTGWSSRAGENASGDTCLDRVPASNSSAGYTIVKVTIRRGRERQPVIYIHLARDPGDHKLRVIGVTRA